MAKHLLISLMSLSSLFHHAHSSGASSNYITLDLSRRHITQQAALDAAVGIPGYHTRLARSQSQSYHAFHTMSSYTNPISGCPGQDFQTNVVVGGQTFSLTVDTGSSTLAVVSNQCGSSCPTPVYTPGSTAQQQTSAPQAQSQYGDGSTWTGRVFQDQVSIGGSPAVPVLFATIDQQSGFFQQGTCAGVQTNSRYESEGIIGFAYPSLAVSSTNTFFSQLVSNAGINNYFAMMECLNTGQLYLGGIDTSSYTGQIYYAPIIEQQWYVVQVTNMLLGGQQLSGVSASTFATDGSQGPTNAIVDSGTTQLVLPTTAYNAIISALNANSVWSAAFGDAATFFDANNYQCSQSNPGGYTFEQLNQQLPSLNIVFAAGFTLNLGAAQSYLLPYDSSLTTYCPGLGNGGASQTILGWGLVNQFVVIYDVGNTRLGFAQQSGCNNNNAGTITAGSATGQGPPSGSSSGSGGSGSGSTTTKPTAKPATAAPTAKPATAAPTAKPATAAPTAKPATAAPTSAPTSGPTSAPTTGHATSSPTSAPTAGHSTSAPATSAPTAGHSTSAPATSAPTSKTCPSGRMGSSCQYYYDELQCQVGVPYSQIGQSFGGFSFSQEFAREMAYGANIPVSSIVVVSITDDGDYSSVTVTFDMLNTTSRLLQNAENCLGVYLNSASQDTQQSQTALASKVTSGGVTNLNNAGSMYDGSSGDSSSSSSMSLGLVAAIAGGAAALIVILIVASICMYRRRQSSTVALTSVHIAKSTEDLPQLEQNYQVSPLQMAQLNNQYQQPTPLYNQQATAWQQQH